MMKSDRKDLLQRRELLGTMGAAALTVSLAATANGETAAPLRIVDFHNHHVPPDFPLNTLANATPATRPYWERVTSSLADSAALLSSIEEAGIAARVINTPTAFIEDPDGATAPETIQRINDRLADLVSRNTGRLYALATVDAYIGDAGAHELTRAVRELGMRGVFVEAAKGELLIDAPQARPTLAAAAALGVPVFIHPINDPALTRRFAKYRRLGVQLARGTVNAAALIALLEGGTFDELPALRVVVTTLALGGVLLAGGFGDGSGIRSDAPALSRRHVYIDTMGLHPALMRSAIALLGADHVLTGTDWPIFVEKSVPERLHKAFAASGLDAVEQAMVAGGNTMKLLGLA